MSRLLLAFILLTPVEASQPSVDVLLQAYAGAGWVKLRHPSEGILVCIDEKSSVHVDRIVWMLAERARKTHCI